MATVIKMPSAPQRSADDEEDGSEKEPTGKPFLINKAVRVTKCRGPKNTCPGQNSIEKGALRLGTRATIDERESVFWRHLDCVTLRMLQNKNINASNLHEYIDFCVNDGTKMAITEKESLDAENALRATLGEAALPIPDDIRRKHEEYIAANTKKPTKKRADSNSSSTSSIKKIKLVE